MSRAPFYPLVACCLAGLSACTMGPSWQRPAEALPATYSSAAALTPAEQAQTSLSPWWETLGDPELNQWVNKALLESPQTRIAAARVEEADALMRQAGASLFPEVNLALGGVNNRVTQLGTTPVPTGVPVVRSDRVLNLSTSYELDVWGRVRSADQAARAQALASRYAQATVHTTLASALVQSWVNLRSLDAQLELLQNNLQTRQDTLAFTQRRQVGGLASQLDAQAALPAVLSLQSQIAETQRQRSLAQNLVAVLVNQPGLVVAARSDLPHAPNVPPGLPSALLEARPDVREAQAQLMGAHARIGVARAALFPTLSLTAATGAQSADLSNLLKPEAFTFALGLNILAPIFDAGRRDAVVAQVRAQQRQLAANYQQVVLGALRDVRDALISTEQWQASIAVLTQQRDALADNLRLTELREASGYSASAQVLDAKRNLNDAELALVRARAARLAAHVDLVKALGGGWPGSAAP